MRINPFVYGTLVLGVFLGVIFAFRSAGVWSISGKVDAAGNPILPSAADVESIKGWMTLGDIATAYNVPLDEILVAFQLPADTTPETAVKDLESETFSVTGLRDWLLSRLEGTSVSDEAAPAEIQSAPNTGTLDGSADPVEQTPIVTPVDSPTPAQGISPEEHTSEDRRVTGKTTFQDLIDWGLDETTISQVVGGELPVPQTLVKDYIIAQGQEFAGVRNALQAEVDKLSR
jgi:hypothetical protein